MTHNTKTIVKTAEEKLTYSVPEAAEILGIGRSAAYQGIRTGQIPSVKIGKRIIVPKVALQQKLQAAGQTNPKG